MRIVLILIIFLTNARLFAQKDADSLPIINKKYSRQIYNQHTNSINFSYDFSGEWDIDGDKKADSLLFIGNGGVHTYFYLRVTPSSLNRTYHFINVQFDMSYPKVIENLKQEIALDEKIILHDFNNDGILDLYLNFNNAFSSIPIEWRKRGVKSKTVIMYFSNKNQVIKDYHTSK